MNFAIEYTSTTFSHLVITPRKKVLKHSLIQVSQGLALVKLGKNEYAVEAGQSVWIPFDCLVSITYFPNTCVEKVDFSIRLLDNFPKQAGYVQQTALTEALLAKLAQRTSDAQATAELLAVLKQEVLEFNPTLLETKMSQRFNQWTLESSVLTQEQTLVMVMREAKKRLQSGQKKVKVVEDLFAGKIEEFEQLCWLVFGEEL
ncbi:AraC family transcriptional regulator [Vibrio sp. T187]|uniref:AraC family transcriptional regulator n=1 Tax=Vibrio TaxID=662 RepID=UPI0010C9EFFC|nr:MULTISPECIES: AraC family transcriptional regulator [Vibrio]MBW3695521.1 AraC family transcriptional regulator [Vibrio sp. T187]